jgi:hypothetical protein
MSYTHMDDYISPVSWTDLGMDWDNPDAKDARYLDAIKLATIERYQSFFATQKALHNWVAIEDLNELCFLPDKEINYNSIVTLHNYVIGLLPIINRGYSDQYVSFVDIDPNVTKWPGIYRGLARYGYEYYDDLNSLWLNSALQKLGYDALIYPNSTASNNAWLLQMYRLLNLMRYLSYSPYNRIIQPSRVGLEKRIKNKTTYNSEITEEDTGWIPETDLYASYRATISYVEVGINKNLNQYARGTRGIVYFSGGGNNCERRIIGFVIGAAFEELIIDNILLPTDIVKNDLEYSGYKRYYTPLLGEFSSDKWLSSAYFEFMPDYPPEQTGVDYNNNYEIDYGSSPIIECKYAFRDWDSD